MVSAGDTIGFTADGGVSPYAYSLVTDAATGSVDPATGVYRAPGSAASAVVRATDKTGTTADASVTVQAAGTGLAISPAAITLNVGAGITFTATGGTPPYSYSMQGSVSGCTLTGADYTAGPTPGTDRVTVTDSLGVTSTATVTVNSPPQPDYSVTFDADIPWSGAVGSSMASSGTTQFTISNSASQGHANITWAVYLSPDKVLDGTDTLIQQATINPLAGSASTNITFAGNWPGPGGLYHLIAVIQSADDPNIANNVVVGHPTGIGTYRCLEGTENNGGVGPTPPPGLTNRTGFTLGANQTIVMEGTMDAYAECDTYQFTIPAGLGRLSTRLAWATGGNSIDLKVWDSTGAEYFSFDEVIDAEPVTGSFDVTSPGTGLWYVSAYFCGSNTGQKYVILVQGLP